MTFGNGKTIPSYVLATTLHQWRRYFIFLLLNAIIFRQAGGGLFRDPPRISETTGAILKIQAAFENPGKNCRWKTNFIDIGVTSDVTGQVKVKMFDISGLVTSASKIAMLSTNKAN